MSQTNRVSHRSDTDTTHRFDADELALGALANTVRLADISPDDYDAVFYAGGHGPLYDLAAGPASMALIENYTAAGKIVAAVARRSANIRTRSGSVPRHRCVGGPGRCRGLPIVRYGSVRAARGRHPSPVDDRRHPRPPRR